MTNFRRSLVLLLFVPALAYSQGQPQYAAFPIQWVTAVSDIYPITNKPSEIQWQASSAIHAMNRPAASNIIYIDVFGEDSQAGHLVQNYFVQHHHYPQSRFVVRIRKERAWNGWVAVYSDGAELPKRPPSWSVSLPPLAESKTEPQGTQKKDELEIITSLASPVKSEELPLLDQEMLAGDTDQEWNTDSGDRFRPAIGAQFLSLETDPTRQERLRASWLGFRAQGETVIYKIETLEFGLGAHYFSTIAGLTKDAIDSNVMEVSAKGYAIWKPEPTAIGMIHLQIAGGYFGSWRDQSSENKVFVASLRGAQLGGTVSTGFDDALRFGVLANYVFTGEGLLEAGAVISHRLFTAGKYPWDVRLAATRSVARVNTAEGQIQETWSSLQVGLAGSI